MGQVLAHLSKDHGAKANSDDSPEKDSLPVREPRKPSRIPTLQYKQQLEDLCNIQPHTDDGGDAYYIGDAYEPAKCAHEWELKDGVARPYLDFIKRVSMRLPHLEYLAHWMEVSCAPPKWKFIKDCQDNRDQRAQRCRVCVMDFADDKVASNDTLISTTGLQTALQKPLQTGHKPPIRVIIAEDLSRDLVELLGSTYDIDPLFFLSHIGDYLFHNTRDRWVELPDLDVVARKRPFLNLQYLRARYFKDARTFTAAERESGSFNVLRRLDSDRSRTRLQNSLLDVNGASVTLMRTKASVWVKPRKDDEPIIAILLVDPTVQPGHPLWGGYRPFSDTPSMHDQAPIDAPEMTSLFNDLVFWTSRMTSQDLETVRKDPKCIALPLLQLLLADWRTILKYMATMLTKIEWEFERPHWGESVSEVASLMGKLSPWRRNLPSYQDMIAESIDRVFQLPPQLHSEGGAKESNSDRSRTGLLSLLHDFRLVQQFMDDSQKRIETIQTATTNVTNVVEAKRAGNQNNNVLRLTILGILFLPLNFTSSFLSMSPDFAQAKSTIWMFFAIGFPLTGLIFIVLDLTRPDGYLPGWLSVLRKGRPKPQPEVPKPQPVEIGRTMPWPTNRLHSGPLR